MHVRTTEIELKLNRNKGSVMSVQRTSLMYLQYLLENVMLVFLMNSLVQRVESILPSLVASGTLCVSDVENELEEQLKNAGVGGWCGLQCLVSGQFKVCNVWQM